MFYYEDGDIKQTNDLRKAQEAHVKKMLMTSRYSLNPAAAGTLRELLGELDPEATKQEARRRVVRTLQELGIENPDIGLYAEALPDAWKLRIEIN